VVKTSEYFEGETLTFHKALMGSTAPSTLSVSTFYRDPGFMNPNAPKFALEKVPFFFFFFFASVP